MIDFQFKLINLESFTSNSSGQKDILLHDGDSVSVNGAHVGVFEETNEVGLGGFLEGEDGRRLESGLRLNIVGDILDESLERKLSDQEISGLLVLSDFSGGNGTGSESVGLLDTTGCGGRLLGGLRVELLSGLLDSSRALSCGGFGSCHFLFIRTFKSI